MQATSPKPVSTTAFPPESTEPGNVAAGEARPRERYATPPGAASGSAGATEPDAATRLDSTPLTQLRGVGPRIAARLAALGIETVLDLLFHLPTRYEDRTRIHGIADLRTGAAALVCGRIENACVRFGRRRSLVVTIDDGTAAMSIRLFHYAESQKRRMRPGRRIACYGEARRGPTGIEMVHPEYKLLDDGSTVPTAKRLTPVYPAVAGLGQALLRRLIEQSLDRLGRTCEPTDLLPPAVAERHRLVRPRPCPGDDPPATGGLERARAAAARSSLAAAARVRGAARAPSRVARAEAPARQASGRGARRRRTGWRAASSAPCRSTSRRPSAGSPGKCGPILRGRGRCIGWCRAMSDPERR